MLNVRLNMNGDDAATLQDQLQAAHSAVTVALDAVNSLTIHGRNYQTLGDGALDALREDRDTARTHIVALHNLSTWLSESWLSIEAQLPAVGD